MSENQITFPIKARYFSFGELNSQTKNIWFLFHGYGQLAKYFLNRFKSLADEKTVLIAPEGLHHFYLKGFTGKVGASWMTREDRLTDIENQISYLDTLHKRIFSSYSIPPRLHVLGFSQGVATAARWIAKSNISIDSFVQYAGSFPKDIESDSELNRFRTTNYIICAGDDDEFISQLDFENEQKRILEINSKAEIIRFEGGHEIKNEVLTQIKYHTN